MDISTHAFALVLRAMFHVLSVAGMGLLMLLKEPGPRVHAYVLLGAACLMASGAVVAPDEQQAIATAVVLLCAVAADVVYAACAPKAPHLLLPALFLCCVGVAMAYDVVPDEASMHAEHVILGMGAGVVACFVSRRLNDWLASSFPVLLLLTILLCAAPLVPAISVQGNGAIVGVRILGHVVQPVELAKVTLALSLSAYLAANAWRLSHLDLKGLPPIAVVFVLALVLELMQNDLGTGLVLFSLFAAMLTLCSRRAGIVYALVLAVCVTVLLYVAAHLSSHVMDRFAAWRDPTSDPQGYGYQAIMGMDAMANGGIVGTGLHFGSKFDSIPEVKNDYVYAAIVEETGVLGAAAVALAVCCQVVVASKAAAGHPVGSFERNLLIAGGSLLACQSFVIVGGDTNVIPLTGVTLPFVSRGGSSMVSCLVLVGLMGGCASAQAVMEPEGQVHPIVLPVAAIVAMALCVSAVIGTQGELRVMGTTKRVIYAGDVRTSDGVLLATSEGFEANCRSYPQGTLAAHLLGTASSGIERRVCAVHLGDPEGLPNLLALSETDEETVLTIDSRLQEEAERQLEGETGAIVVMDATTGAILAMASSPTYEVATGYDPEAGDGVSYLNRAIAIRYAPGSTFKVVTMAAALDTGVAGPESVYTGDTIDMGADGKVTNYDDACYGDISLTDALACSSNTAFAELALEMGEGPIRDMADGLGFGGGLEVAGFDVVSSRYVSPQTPNDYMLAWSSVGQPVWVGGVECGPSVTVLQMCSVMAAVANGGMRPNPYLIKSGPFAAEHGDGTVAMSVSTASQLWDMMVASSVEGIAGVEVAGKTGTAQYGAGTHCWYICSAEGFCVACCIESDTNGLGSTVTCPRAMNCLAAALDID